MNRMGVYIAMGVVGGLAALGAVAGAVWNSREMRMARAVKRTGKVLYQVGSVLQSASCVAKEI